MITEESTTNNVAKIGSGVLHGSTFARSEGSGFRFVSPPQPWSYAVSFPLERLASAAHPAIRATLLVHKGRVGVGGVTADGSTYCTAERMAQPQDGPVQIYIPIKSPEVLSSIIFRKSDSANQSAEFDLIDVQIIEGVSAPRTDHLDTTTGRAEGGRAWGSFDQALETLRGKWHEIPAGLGTRRSTRDLLSLDDQALLGQWWALYRETSEGSGFSLRGWYHELYKPILAGQRVLEIGCGLGIDGVAFSLAGAHVTFVDIIPENVAVARRICQLLDIRTASFLYLSSLDALERLPYSYDFVLGLGSLLHTPMEVMQKECRAIVSHLKPDGRWIELAYPKERWIRDGELPFSEWGELTDGENTPWAEYYDLQRWSQRMAPEIFEPVLNFSYHDDDFIWFDMKRQARR
jgi:SAM-dependent methyltransferase